jgi:tetratricopeptide (TPR) repeat protein
MRKLILSVWAMMAILAYAGLALADDEPKTEPSKQTVEERQQQRKEALQGAMNDKDFDKAISLLEEMIGDKEVSDDDKFMAGFYEFHLLATEKHDGAKACPLAKKLADEKKDDPQILNELSWTILDTADLKDRDLDLALEIAKAAAEASKNESSAILDTLARAHFEKGDLDKAIEYQEKAVEKSENDEELKNMDDGEKIKTQIKETLEKYKAKKAEAK